MTSSTNLSTSTISSADIRESLTIVEIKPGLRFPRKILRDMLPDIQTVLFFGKVYDLDATQLAHLLSITMGNSDVLHALVSEGGTHSTELQSYVVDLMATLPEPEEGEVTFDPHVPTGEILPELWEMLEVEVASSIKAVAAKLEKVVGMLPGKTGAMHFKSMAVLNAKRPVIGDYRARIHHAPQKQNLLILDVSGSMSESTVRRIVDDVVALSYKANAHMAVVSDTCTYWEPGSYSVQDVLDACEFNGTHYEQLGLLLEQDWGTVISVADYDSCVDAKSVFAARTGHIDEVLDISLVNRPTFLAECLATRASSVRPLLTAKSNDPRYLPAE